MKGVLTVVFAAALAASAPLAAHPGSIAKAKRKAPRFAVTVEGTLRTVWLEETRLVEDECTFDMRVSGSKRIDFRSRRPTVVRLTAAGLRTTTVRFVAGEITGAAGSRSSSSSEGCDKTTNAEGPELGGGFRDATLALSSPGRGLVRLSRLHLDVPDNAAWASPAFGRAAPPLERAPGRIDERKLRNPRLTTIVVAGRYQNVRRLAGDVTGNLLQVVDWTLAFRRLRR